ncbi:MAG: hypothetical protein ACM3MK_13075 [Chitinophagales bacterium]
MRQLLSLLTIISILLSGVSADIFGISSNNHQNQYQAGSPSAAHRATMQGPSRDYLASEIHNFAILPVVSGNNYIKPMREASNKLFLSGFSPFTVDKEWTYLFQSVVPKSTFQNIYHSIQPRAPNSVALA